MQTAKATMSTENIFFGLGVAVFAGSLYFALQFDRFVVQEGEPIAVLTSMRGEARVKQDDFSLWQTIGLNKPIFSGNVLATKKGSQALVQMNDGTEIILQENAQISFLTGRDDAGQLIRLQVQGGTIRSQKSQSGRVRVVTKVGEYKIEKKQASFSASAYVPEVNVDTKTREKIPELVVATPLAALRQEVGAEKVEAPPPLAREMPTVVNWTADELPIYLAADFVKMELDQDLSGFEVRVTPDVPFERRQNTLFLSRRQLMEQSSTPIVDIEVELMRDQDGKRVAFKRKAFAFDPALSNKLNGIALCLGRPTFGSGKFYEGMRQMATCDRSLAGAVWIKGLADLKLPQWKSLLASFSSLGFSGDGFEENAVMLKGNQAFLGFSRNAVQGLEAAADAIQADFVYNGKRREWISGPITRQSELARIVRLSAPILYIWDGSQLAKVDVSLYQKDPVSFFNLVKSYGIYFFKEPVQPIQMKVAH